jgi:hypothetical protein
VTSKQIALVTLARLDLTADRVRNVKRANTKLQLEMHSAANAWQMNIRLQLGL